MAKGAPILSLTEEELAVLKPFVQKFSKATEAVGDWSDRRDFHRLVTEIYSGVKSYNSCFSTPEVEKILQGVPSLKKMKVCRAPTSYKLFTGRWTTDVNDVNMEIIKEQMEENIKKKALLKQRMAHTFGGPGRGLLPKV